jgi:AraC-like DNA-binding protein
VTVILDTSDLPPCRRADAVAEVLEFSGARSRLVYNSSDDEVSARFEHFTIGEARVLKSRKSPLGLIATPALLDGAQSDQFVVSLRVAGTATHSHAPGRLLSAGDLFVMNLWRPYEYVDDGGENAGLHLPFDRLGLERDYVARASEVIHTSPLAGQLQRHLRILFRDVDTISRGPAAATVAQATVDLVRAALISAVDEEPFRGDGLDQNLTAVVKSYITQHLADPDLGAERIARAMFISVRRVYKIWETEPRPLGQWILERRLEAARHELASRRGRNQTIAAMARRWGFADSTHFSRRFRQAYGMSPREWRHDHRSSGSVHA